MQEAVSGLDGGSLILLSKCLQSSNRGKHCTFWLWPSSDLNQVFGLLLLYLSTDNGLVESLQSCPATNPSMLNVHLVPHTHDDVGWLKTVDQYYYGGEDLLMSDLKHAGVQYILDSVIDQLQKDPARRFIYVETAFFYRWWRQQSQSTQKIVAQLVNEGRLEFINGGWCMSDEATTHYSAVIDQMTLGLRFFLIFYICSNMSLLIGLFDILSCRLERAMGVAQHHDAVSGTEKQHVAYDYARRLATGWAHCEVLVRNSLAVLSGSEAPRVFCENLNISVCPLTESSHKFSMNVYNPLGRTVSWPVRLPVNGSVYNVTDANGRAVDSQVGNVFISLKCTCYIYYMKSSCLLPLLSVRWFHFSINNTSVTFDDTTGLLSSLTNLETDQTIQLTQNFYWYNASAGNNKESRQTSGAYIFRPNSSDPFVINKTAETQIVTVSSTAQEVTQRFSPWVSQVVRLYEGHRELELEWTVGPVPVADGLGKEVITRLDTDIKSSDYFYTDSNGREVLERRKDYRPTWELKQTEPVAGNYYPINSRAYIKDDKHQLTVVTDRSQGASSIYNGSLEIMLHRRLLYDDFRGVGEPLSEPGEFSDGLVARGRLLLTLSPPDTAADVHRPLAQGMVLQPLLSFQDGTPSANTKLEFSGLQTSLPPAVHLLTLSQWDKDTVLIRLEHQYQAKESKTHSQPVTVNLQKLFSTLEVLGASEMSLGANQWKEDMNRLQWNTEKTSKPLPLSDKDPSPWEVTLNPMEIRTLLLRVRQL
uniref:Lysosomal alpha-mannosidase n=1 Tax=Sinocyclocheilus grahami TaxID=75366 RepID=A0A672MN70_SINGR